MYLHPGLSGSQSGAGTEFHPALRRCGFVVAEEAEENTELSRRNSVPSSCGFSKVEKARSRPLMERAASLVSSV
jgi:hypothetical protein